MTQQRRRPSERRLWDSTAIIAYLAGEPAFRDSLEGIIERARHREVQIMVSVFATVEVAYIRGTEHDVAEATILDFFSRDFVTPIAIDARIAAIARRLVRAYEPNPGLKPPDATHLATAVAWNIPVVETTDPDLLRLDGQEGQPPIAVRYPLYEGPRPFPNMP